MEKDMDKPTPAGDSSTSRTGTRIISRETATMGCGFSNFTTFRAEKQDFARLAMPQYLRLAILDSIRKQDVDGGDQHFQMPRSDDDPSCETPIVVFINPKSGGRHGPVLKERLQNLISEEQAILLFSPVLCVFDLHDVKPHEFVRYGLACLEKWAESGDACAKETRMNIRVVVAGGDGTVGWVFGCLGELHQEGRLPVPPVAIIPLGTGNDLSRSLGWGGSFPFSWKSAIKRTLQRATTGPICHLDSWHVVVQMPGGEVVDPPHSLKPAEECDVDQFMTFDHQVL
ncbi:Diacylglycerol kinase 7 [Hibiscus syriacus]|uniref:Diacylglycerol kinase 7 n=1 Tax=Hibiscus syriacus TaxID=106335 RepID=A0A6A2X1K4_HIBSY|nr:Diacylglycerol kinase 7 [Hibiscus syriacus]